MNNLHTFVVCAYGPDTYLEACVQSLRAQTLQSDIIIAASAKSDEITRVADAYGIDVRIYGGEPDMAGLLNFSLLQATASPYVTIAYPDCIYEPRFTEAVLAKAQKSKNPLLIFTDCYDESGKEGNKKKHIQRSGGFMRGFIRLLPASKFARSFALSTGNSICTKSVTYATAARYRFRFSSDFAVLCDWDAFERLGRRKGSFIYLKKPLVGIQTAIADGGSEYSADLEKTEEYYMLRRFWPKAIADTLQKIKSKSQTT